MIKVNKEGKEYHYYYKKKVGRHKKPGKKIDKDNPSYAICYKISKNYPSIFLFREHEERIYSYCEYRGWLKKLYPLNYRYKLDTCNELCKIYEYSDDLRDNDINLYNYIIEKGWLGRIFKFRKEYYSKINCYNRALKYKTYKEFRINDNQTYMNSLHHNWLINYTWLIDDRVFIYIDKIDCIYAYIFDKLKSVYIGRTLIRRIHDRDMEHIYSDDIVSKYSKENNITIPNITVLESGLTIQEGLDKENYYIKYYNDLGYRILNKAKTGIGSGSIGSLGKGKWNKEKCNDVAKLCHTITEFRKKYGGAFRVAKNNEWLKDYIWFKEKPRRNYWTFEKCKEIVNQCNNKNEFLNEHHDAYSVCCRNGWLNELFNNNENSIRKSMKNKKIYKIDVSSMVIVDTFDNIKDITNKTWIYKVINGERSLFSDGYLYRLESDIIIDQETGIVIDKLHVENKHEKKEKKYNFVIELIKNNSGLSISEICNICKQYGHNISEPTCRKLKREYY